MKTRLRMYYFHSHKIRN